jgi:flavin-dependent dehydrogenase
MLEADVVVAGGGVSGLLIASALAPHCSLILLEQAASLPRNKYWLTDELAVEKNPSLEPCVDRRYRFMDFVAYDGLRTRVQGKYCLWDTNKLVNYLAGQVTSLGGRVMTGHRLYSISPQTKAIDVRANSELIRARLLIDCMGFGSPLVGAKNLSVIAGYYILYGQEVGLTQDTEPIALDNVIIDRRPAFFELFPTSKNTAHAGIILPARNHRPDRPLKSELNFILQKSHYRDLVKWDPKETRDGGYFGIIPVGSMRHPALDRILFFGEAGQANPAASATGFSRMLHTYRELAQSLIACILNDNLQRRQLLRAIPQYMSTMNRVFQESLFHSLLSYDSDDFRRLVEDLSKYPSPVVNDLIFGSFRFGPIETLKLGVRALVRPRGVLGPNILKSARRLFSFKRSR